MIDKQIKIWSTIVLIIVLIPDQLFAQEPNDIKYKFTQTDSSYTFYGSFRAKVPTKCLLDISFNYNHIKALALDAKEVSLIDQGSNWNQISYTYRKFIFFINTTVWHRVFSEEDQRVDFTLLSSENNRKIMPRLVASSGYYQVTREEEYSNMEYYQQCQLTEKSITKLYINKVKKNAIKFMYKFSEYASTFCSDSTLQLTN